MLFYNNNQVIRIFCKIFYHLFSPISTKFIEICQKTREKICKNVLVLDCCDKTASENDFDLLPLYLNIEILLVPDDQSKWGYMPWLLELQKIFIFLFVILLGANGIVICCIFTFNSRIYGLYRKWFFKRSNVGQFPRSIRSWNRNRKISSMSTITNTTSLYY